MGEKETDIRSLLELSANLSSAEVFEGYARDDENVRDNLLIVESPQVIYSFSKSDIIEEEQIGASGQEEIGGRRVRVWVRTGSQAFRTTTFTAGESISAYKVGMEHVAPSVPKEVPGMPVVAAPSTVNGAEAMEYIAPPAPEEVPGMPTAASAVGEVMPTAVVPPLSSVGANWRNSCAGGDRFSNNCAHFLSDAFIRAGYTDLQGFGERCYTPAKRPIRAREMWSWFNTRAVRRCNTVQRNTGWWAVFQLDESVYWGGHVALLDSDSWQYYGTGWYANWRQHLYQW